MDMAEMMKMAGQLRDQMAQAQAQAQSVSVTGEAGGGLVKVTMNGERQVLRVEIDAGLWGQKDERSLVEDLARAAFNAASGQAEAQLRGPLLKNMSRQMGIDPAMLDALGKK